MLFVADVHPRRAAVRRVTDFVEFLPWDFAPVAARGFDGYAVYRLFFGEPAEHETVTLLTGCAPATASFHAGEYNAANVVARAFRRRRLELPDPWTGETIAATASFTFPARGDLPAEMLPLVYPLTGRAGQKLWAVSYGVSGRITQLICPGLDVVLYLRDRDLAALIAARVRQAAPDWRARAAAGACCRKVVGVLDLVLNFGHQLIHQLSGLQRLLDESGPNQADEIWLSGTEFFGPAENLFPECAGRLRRFSDRWAMHADLAGGDHLALPLGSNLFPRALRTRILGQAPAAPGRPARRPLIAVTVRTAGRACSNLVPALREAILRLLPRHPGLGVLIDGWVLPQSELMLDSPIATALSPRYLQYVLPDIEAALELAAALPESVVTGCLIGAPMLASLAALAGIDAYIAHVGTLQHKLGFFSGAPGIVHGPRLQLAAPEGGAFQSEVGRAPAFLPPEAVRDLGPPPARGPGYADYEITDLDALPALLAAALG